MSDKHMLICIINVIRFPNAAIRLDIGSSLHKIMVSSPLILLVKLVHTANVRKNYGLDDKLPDALHFQQTDSNETFRNLIKVASCILLLWFVVPIDELSS